MAINVTKDDENGELDELVDLIDRMMESGDGHLTIDVDENSNGLKVKRYCATDCGSKGACCQPTELLDEDKD